MSMNEERPIITEHDAISGETLVRPMTDEEYAEWLARPKPEPLA